MSPQKKPNKQKNSKCLKCLKPGDQVEILIPGSRQSTGQHQTTHNRYSQPPTSTQHDYQLQRKYHCY